MKAQPIIISQKTSLVMQYNYKGWAVVWLVRSIFRIM